MGNRDTRRPSVLYIPVYDFYKAILYSDLRHLVKEFDGNGFDEYKDDVVLKENLNNIIKESAYLSNDTKTLKVKKKQFSLLQLEFKYDGIKTILNMYNIVNDVKLLELVIDFGFKVNINDTDVIEKVKNIKLQLKRLKNKINISKLNLEKIIKKTDSDNKAEDIMMMLDKEALFFERYLELGYMVDKKVITLERWIRMRQMASEKKKALEN